MIRLAVLPKSVHDGMQDEGIDLSVLKDPQQALKQLSLHDLALIHRATAAFPFEFDPQLNIVLDTTVHARLVNGELEDDNAAVRLVSLVTSYELQDVKHDVDHSMSQYRLKPIDEHFWVAVQQRLHTEGRDPNLTLYSSNRAFFESIVSQVTHVMPFETVCKTRLFSNYLKSLPSTALESE